MLIQPIRTPLFHTGDDLANFVIKYIRRLPNRSVLVVTSKIVALSQKRVVEASDKALSFWIKKESEIAIKTKWCYLTQKDGHWCPNAGIDESNAHGKLILWPIDAFAVADGLRQKLRKHYKISQLGILITDSRVFPLRAGVVGVALGYSGFKGLRDYRGQPDLFGKKLRLTQTNIPDTLASAAILVMGEGRERQPLAIIRDAPITFTTSVDQTELHMDPRHDLYRPLFARLTHKK